MNIDWKVREAKRKEDISNLKEPKFVQHWLKDLELCQTGHQYSNGYFEGCMYCGNAREDRPKGYRPCIFLKAEAAKKRYDYKESVCLDHLIEGYEMGPSCDYGDDIEYCYAQNANELKVVRYFAGLRCGYKDYLSDRDIEYIQRINEREKVYAY